MPIFNPNKSFTKACKHLGLSFWLTMLGGVIIFGSWLAQNQFKAKWDDKILMLQRSQLVVDVGEVNRSIWEIAYYNEYRRKPTDMFGLAKAALELTKAELDLYTWGIARVSEDPTTISKMMDAKHMIDTTARQDLLNGNYEHIFEAFKFVNKQFEMNYMKLDQNFSDKVDEVRRTQDFWQTIFMVLYAVGSILLGGAYLKERVDRANSRDKMGNTSTPQPLAPLANSVEITQDRKPVKRGKGK